MSEDKALNFLNEHYRIITDFEVNQLAYRFRCPKKVLIEEMLEDGWIVDKVGGAIVAKYFSPKVKDKNAIIDKGAYRPPEVSDDHIEVKRPNER